MSVANYMKTRTRRLMLSLFVSLQLGLFKHGRATDMIKVSVPKAGPDEDILKGTTKVDQPEVQAMRRACSNTFSFTTSLLADTQVWKLNRIIVHILRPLQRWHSTQNKTNRSPAESLQWWCSMANGEGFGHINDTLEQMQDMDLFKALRVQTGEYNLANEHDDIEDMEIDFQNELCEVIGNLRVEIICRRLRTLSEHSMPPYNFPALLGEQSAMALKQLQSNWELWMEVRDLTGTFWSKVQKRSRFSWRKVLQVVSLCRGHRHWEISDAARSVITQDFMGLSQTKVVEDGVRVCKTAVVNQGHNTRIADARCWDTLIHSDVLKTKHRYPSLQWQDQPMPAGLSTHTSSSLYHVQADKLPKTWSEIVSKSPKVPGTIMNEYTPLCWGKLDCLCQIVFFLGSV